ncbi:MAG: VWA domain-containing protein [Clostridia bacterium]|nr:VWA domain-containing protein [Clostridia bacterium]
MQTDLTEAVFILDRSGSMGGKERDTIGAFNSLIEQQKKLEGRVLVTTILFDDQYEVLFERVPLEKVRPINERQYYVRGCTALLDAVGRTIEDMRAMHMADGPMVPAHTLFIINTDGLENASRRYTFNDVRALLSHQRDAHGWEFLFLGANMDAIASAANIGICASRAASTYADSSGIRAQYKSVGRAMKAVRMDMDLDCCCWDKDIQQDAAMRNPGKKAKSKAGRTQATPNDPDTDPTDADADTDTAGEDEISRILNELNSKYPKDGTITGDTED